MRARFILALVVLSVVMISGCNGYGHLYPVQGPLASMAPQPVYNFSYTYPGSPKNDRGQNGDLSMVLSDGEIFQGPWKMTYQKPAMGNASAGTQESSSMATAWDTVYGQGFYVAHILGSKPYFMHVALTGNKGTTLQVEWYEPEFSGTTIQGTNGIAEDSKGNIYKLVL
jgi:hypothetical protein